MRIGIDFDNTLACYDDLFHDEACRRRLISAALPASKRAIRDALRSQSREAEWTALQGAVYGTRMSEARPFPGAIEFFRRCCDLDVEISIVSHKTQFPAAGPRYDLHRAALDWLTAHRFFDPTVSPLAQSDVEFRATRAEKIDRIAELHCTHFVDDLVEVLEDPRFPSEVERILFDPHRANTIVGYRSEPSWARLAISLLDTLQ